MQCSDCVPTRIGCDVCTVLQRAIGRLDHLSTFVDPLVVIGDVSIHLERPSDLHSCQCSDIIAAHGLVSHVSCAMHKLGGALDIVASREDLPALSVDVLDTDLSDHCLLQWMAPLAREKPVYRSMSGRP